MATRRGFLKGAAAAPLATARGKAKTTGIYERLGIRSVINGVGVVIVLGGFIMLPEVVRVMEEASQHFVPLPELQKKVGARIAEMLNVPAAMVTGGAASSIAIGTSACLSRGDAEKLRRLPDVTGTRHEVIIQKAHRCGYEWQMQQTGAKLVWVETRKDLDAAINDRTAMMFFLNKADPDGQIDVRGEPHVRAVGPHALEAAVLHHVLLLMHALHVRKPPRERWRWTGEGPHFIKLGGRVVYRLEDIEGRSVFDGQMA